MEQAPEISSAETKRPSLSFETITFSDGTQLALEDDDIVVFVGPNNAGKSAALRELEAWVARDQPGNVITSATLKKDGTSDDLKKYLEKNSHKNGLLQHLQYAGMGYSIHHSHINYFDNLTDRHPVSPFFAKRLATETRIQDSSAAPSIALFQSPPTHPIHLLLMDEELAAATSEKFRHAFGKDLTPFRAGGGSHPLYVGEKPKIPVGKDELSKEFIEQLISTNTSLDSQGDGMRSFAAVLLHTLVTNNHSIQFLDEPEAFLHPPQARLLGRYIAETRREKSQLFIATHSTDILDGLIEGGLANVRIVRIRREGDLNHIRELSKDQTQEVTKDALARFSRVYDGIFFEHVIICESDADCMFYQSILNLPAISGKQNPDVLFVHTSGKHRMEKLVSTLKALDIPVSVIVDIDILNEQQAIKALFERLGGDWNVLQQKWKAISDTVKNLRPPLTASQIVEMISKQISDVSGTGEFPKKNEKAIKDVFRLASPWNSLKQSGVNGLPNGEPTKRLHEVLIACSLVGLWIVPVGEMEGFCRTVGLHGPSFVEKVLEERDLASDPELEDARNFVTKIWAAARRAA